MRNILSFHKSLEQPWPYPYTPTANTILYFPFVDDANDYSGNNYTLDSTGTQETIGRRFNTAVNFNKTNTLGYFGSYWMKIHTKGTGKTQMGNDAGVQIWFGTVGGLDYQQYNGRAPNYGERIQFIYNSSWSADEKKFTTTLEKRYHIAYGYSASTGAVCWIDGVKYTLTTTHTPRTPTLTNEFLINSTDTKFDVTLSDVISETEIWTDQQVSDYFNANKSRYGL